jgi:hypothetical protein
MYKELKKMWGECCQGKSSLKLRRRRRYNTLTGNFAEKTGGGQCRIELHLIQSEIIHLEGEAEFLAATTATKKVIGDGTGIKDVK